MASVNKVILIGNLGADPEVRYMENGQCVANIRIATNRAYTNRNNERVEETEWHSVVFWGKLGEITEKYLKKGNTIYVEGRLRTRKWTDQNGQDRYTTEIIGENMTMLGGRPQDNMGGNYTPPAQGGNTSIPAQQSSKPAEQPQQDSNIDDLPF